MIWIPSKHGLAWLFIALLLTGSSRGWSQPPALETLTLSIPVQLNDAQIKKLLSNKEALPMVRLTSLLKPLGYKLQLKFHLGRRSLTAANSGDVDGLLAREINSPKPYKNLVCTLYYTSIQPVLYGLKQDSNNSDKPSHLQSIATPRGSGFMTFLLPETLQQAEFISTNRHIQSIRLVVSGRAQAALMEQSLFRYLKKASPLETRQLVPLQPALKRYPVYTFLHKKHSALVEQLNGQIERTNAKNAQQRCPAAE